MASSSYAHSKQASEDMTVHADTVSEVEKGLPTHEVYEVAKQNQERCHIHNQAVYKHMYERSLHDADNFWREMAETNLRWISKFTKVFSGSMKEADIAWFLNGKLNVCDNCVDRWAEQDPDRLAIIWEGDEPGDVKRVTYGQLMTNVCKMANLLKRIGVRKFDTVGIYMPMVPEALYAMLACARIGAVHSVIFAGFSAPNLRDRLVDAHCRFVITADYGMRGGKPIQLKEIVDAALLECPLVETCVVFKHETCHAPPQVSHLISSNGDPTPSRRGTQSAKPANMVAGRDVDGHSMLQGMRPYCPLEPMDSEDLLFMLYTSGSTGKPKGIAHSTAGYLLFAALTFKHVFDWHPGDIFACVADIGWITGHSYIVYGPLCNGATTLMFESVPTYPTPARYWDMVERHKITQFYTAPTAIRALMRHGDDYVTKHDLSSLRVLGSVGEPINPEAWRWYNQVVGKGKCDIVDTYWQTETGGHIITPLPGAIKKKPGSATLPFFGIEPVILDSKTGQELRGNGVHGVLCLRRPWPGMMRTVYGDHERMSNVYTRPYEGLYFTGDGAVRDKDGYYWITGRVDDTINVSGHRIGSAEIEHALVQHPGCAEAAVVGFPHDLKGSGLFCYCTLKAGFDSMSVEQAVKELKMTVRKEVGAFATPDYILITTALPKTRSGKIMRRLLRKIASKDTSELGDTSTLADPSVVEELISRAQALFSAEVAASARASVCV